MTVKKSVKKARPGRGGVQLTTPGPGRPKGVPNKFTTLKQAFLDAFEKLGGAEALYNWAKENKHNKGAFYQMTTKLFPQEVAHSGEIKTNDPLVIKVIHIKAGDPGNDGNGDGKK